MDAFEPLDKVFGEVLRHIRDFYALQYPHQRHILQQEIIQQNPRFIRGLESEGAELLARGLRQCESGQVWDGAYARLQSTVLDVSADPRPFVGLTPYAPESIVSFLQQQGYIVDTADTATRCGIYLDAATLAGMTDAQLVDFIEASPSPLVRYWRWPDGAKCALCVTGDLDALTLLDYASRLFVK